MSNPTPRWRSYYLHTLGGQPATYVSGGQICYANAHGAPARLCSSLRHIRMERRFSEQWRAKQGYAPTDPKLYGYRRVRTP
mgnify:FL=1